MQFILKPDFGAKMFYPMKPKSHKGILLPLPVSIESIAR